MESFDQIDVTQNVVVEGAISWAGTVNNIGVEEWCLLGCYAVWLL
jgi:hypothetical protein